jgi:hypothetical protein
MTNYVIVDAMGEAAVVENGHSGCGIRRADETGLLVCTNHFMTPEMVAHTPPYDAHAPLRYISTRTRYDRALTIAVERAPHVDLAAMVEIARDHQNGPSALSLCAHGEVNAIAAGSVGMFCYDPADAAVHVIDGRPCRHAVQTFDLPWPLK